MSVSVLVLVGVVVGVVVGGVVVVGGGGGGVGVVGTVDVGRSCGGGGDGIALLSWLPLLALLCWALGVGIVGWVVVLRAGGLAVFLKQRRTLKKRRNDSVASSPAFSVV